MIFAVIRVLPKSTKRAELMEILRYVKSHAEVKPGCLGCGAFEAADGSGQVLYEEQWRSEKDLDAHIQSGLYRSLLQAIELAREQPQISFHEVSQTRSMELISHLRAVKPPASTQTPG